MPQSSGAAPYHAFDDPVNDRILGVTLALAAEVWSLRERLGLLETAVSRRGLNVSELIEELAADPGRSAEMIEDRDGFIERVMRPITDYKHTSKVTQPSSESRGG